MSFQQSKYITSSVLTLFYEQIRECRQTSFALIQKTYFKTKECMASVNEHLHGEIFF